MASINDGLQFSIPSVAECWIIQDVCHMLLQLQAIMWEVKPFLYMCPIPACRNHKLCFIMSLEQNGNDFISVYYMHLAVILASEWLWQACSCPEEITIHHMVNRGFMLGCEFEQILWMPFTSTPKSVSCTAKGRSKYLFKREAHNLCKSPNTKNTCTDMMDCHKKPSFSSLWAVMLGMWLAGIYWQRSCSSPHIFCADTKICIHFH